jgi:hypothetical protein
MFIKNGNKNHMQQGDVNIEELDEVVFRKLKKEKVNPSHSGFILAEGETTGHAHRVKDIEKVECYKTFDEYLQEECLLLNILDAPATITHEEHGTITFKKKGFHKISRTFEFDPFEHIAKKVQD